MIAFRLCFTRKSRQTTLVQEVTRNLGGFTPTYRYSQLRLSVPIFPNCTNLSHTVYIYSQIHFAFPLRIDRSGKKSHVRHIWTLGWHEPLVFSLRSSRLS